MNSYYLNDNERQECSNEVEFSRIINSEDRKLPYRNRLIEKRKMVHWINRQSLLLDIEFLCNHGNLSNDVIFIGKYNKCLPFLADLFPNHKFWLYSTVEPEYKHDNIIWQNSQEYPNSAIAIFNSLDMEQQIDMYNTINPLAASLRFKLPYTDGETTYLSGKLYYPIWGSSTSTISKLEVTSSEMQIYNNKDYESKMYRFNTCTRFQKMNTIINMGNIPKNYDIVSELFILSNYLRYIGKPELEIEAYLKGLEINMTKYFKISLEDKYEEFKKKTMEKINKEKKKNRRRRN
jgi:hypothetical protein